jgi:hypothetical protein
MNTYPVVDPLSREDRAALGLTSSSYGRSNYVFTSIRAVATGEKRCPKAGEWYLSGTVCEAYRASNNLSTAFFIAKLVKTKATRI